MDDLGTATLVVFSLSDPHSLERSQTSQDRTTEPDRVKALWGSKHLDSVVGGRELVDLVPHALVKTLKQGGTTTHDNVLEEVTTHVSVALHHRVEAVLMHTLEVVSGKAGVKQDFSAAETLVANQDLAAIGQLVVLFASVALLGLLHGGVVVSDDIAHSLLDVAHDF